ncbi:MAG: class I SAM-dependent methyltransferase [Proteobacteria bacterium]|nr:class I SAM-dependent methyltransferase [Pseudomonadota bacterium]
MNEPNKPSETRGWDTYWQGTRDKDSYALGGASHPAITSFWDDTLSQILASTTNARILDIATGSGAVIEKFFHHSTDAQPDITCVDISDAAIDGVRRRFPAITGIVADARSIPLESFRYDLVTSQFGIEYAGLDALDEAARLIAPGGTLAMLMHVRPGLIFDECSAALDAVQRTQKAEFVERALRFFESGFAAVRGADRAPYDQAASDLNPAIEAVDTILSEHGEHVAGGTIAKLYFDVERIHTRIQTHDPDEVLEWLRTMVRELADYGERMASMCDAAIDEKAFGDAGERLRKHGLTIAQGEPLLPVDGVLPVAWALQAVRAG